MSFFLSWASLKLLTGSLFCSPSVSMSGISLRLCVGVKRPSMLLLSLLWGSCNSFAVKRTNCYREFYRSVCWWDFLVAYNSPSCACPGPSTLPVQELYQAVTCYAPPSVFLFWTSASCAFRSSHILCWHTRYTTCPWLAQFVFSVPCIPAGAVCINKPNPSISQSLRVRFFFFVI